MLCYLKYKTNKTSKNKNKTSPFLFFLKKTNLKTKKIITTENEAIDILSFKSIWISL